MNNLNNSGDYIKASWSNFPNFDSSYGCLNSLCNDALDRSISAINPQAYLKVLELRERMQQCWKNRLREEFDIWGELSYVGECLEEVNVSLPPVKEETDLEQTSSKVKSVSKKVGFAEKIEVQFYDKEAASNQIDKSWQTYTYEERLDLPALCTTKEERAEEKNAEYTVHFDLAQQRAHCWAKDNTRLFMCHTLVEEMVQKGKAHSEEAVVEQIFSATVLWQEMEGLLGELNSWEYAYFQSQLTDEKNNLAAQLQKLQQYIGTLY